MPEGVELTIERRLHQAAPPKPYHYQRLRYA